VVPSITNRFLIGGQWVAASNTDVFDVIDSSTEEVIETVGLAGTADIDAAVNAARRAFDQSDWRSTTPGERADMLQRLSEGILARSSDIATMVSRENGNPISTSTMIQAAAPAGAAGYFAQITREFPFDEPQRTAFMGNPLLVTREPVGVAAAIVPWNVPLSIAMLKVGPALAAGCTVVLKTDPHTALDAKFLGEAILDAGIPDGVVNIVPADRTTSEYLVCHPDVDKVSLTGSTAAGRRVASLCGERLRPCTLELGGKSAAIVAEDADVGHVVQSLLPGMIMINGQACVAQTRLLLPRSRYKEFVDAFTAAFAALTVGPALDPGTQVGPLISERQRSRVMDYIAVGVKEGATVAVGGLATDVDGKGFFVQPTLLTDVAAESTVAQEEIFGPVISVIAYENIDDAIAIANDSIYGLSGSVWTADDDLGLSVARRVRTGTININYFNVEIAGPFGGYKCSGIGRENGPEALNAYLEYKSIGIQSQP
jgi:betaine-aldehyde dehydrogenase